MLQPVRDFLLQFLRDDRLRHVLQHLHFLRRRLRHEKFPRRLHGDLRKFRDGIVLRWIDIGRHNGTPGRHDRAANLRAVVLAVGSGNGATAAGPGWCENARAVRQSASLAAGRGEMSQLTLASTK
jgi:hypothetical protein